jgi:hypothetical protein
MCNETGDTRVELPPDAPEPPAGFNEPVHTNHAPEEPPRFDCLVCDKQYLSDDELRSHVEDTHTRRDLYTTLLPVNFPLVAWYADSEMPYTVYTARAARYARQVLEDDGVTPGPVRRFTNDRHPVSNDPLNSSHPATLARNDDHGVWELYQVIRDSVPVEFEWSPVFDDSGCDEPAATVNRLQPGDAVAWRAGGWTQSLGTPRGQPRDQISDEDDWEADGVVVSITDDRGQDVGNWGDTTSRQVTVVAETEVVDGQIEAQMEPRSDGTVLVSFQPQVTQERTSQQHGHGSAGNTRAYIRAETDIDRLPWWHRG